MAEGRKVTVSDMDKKRQSSSSVDETENQPKPGLYRTFSLKDVWRNKKKIPRGNLEKELVICKEELSELQIKVGEEQQAAEKNKKRCTNLQQQLKDANETIRRLEEEKRKAIDSKKEQSEKIETILHNNPYYVYIMGSRNVQIGDDNTIVQDEGNTEQLVAELEELTNKLTSAIQTNTQERAEDERKLRNYDVMFKEFNKGLNILKESLKTLDKNTFKKQLSRDRELLEVLTSDRTDENVITDGIRLLRRFINENMDITDLPLQTETAITRLVNKFGSLKCDCQKFAEILEVDLSRLLSEPNESMPALEHYSELDSRMCENILVHWMKKSRDNDAKKLLEKIMIYESKISTEMVKEFEDETIGLQQSVSTQMPSLTLSENSTGSIYIPSDNIYRGQSLQGLPDRRSQFMHQLEGLKILVDVQQKVNDIHGNMFRVTETRL
ncbi:uncharacterized protein LOC123523407 [Mercenaria mercenaria]|uniref:uncharacterized protein LOC123523407 n=1 Tax=Mercenaria mercenaria TaxID=6596 RepID=UPI00234E81BA|nr:uncharacterized protein LOC123523407 [Mercenaria mercenaria]